MKSQLVLTSEGSHTLYVPQLDEHYHSVHGSVQEAVHVYLRAGFDFCEKNTVNLLEVGFGTGLNAFLTLLEAERTKRHVKYCTLELYPIETEVFEQLNFAEIIGQGRSEAFLQLHKAAWNEEVQINEYFTLKKINADLESYVFDSAQNFDVVYFDAFAPDKQPQLWTAEIFAKIYVQMNYDAVLTTYSTKGIVKQALRDTGFTVKRLPGPKGKHQMLRAIKNYQN